MTECDQAALLYVGFTTRLSRLLACDSVVRLGGSLVDFIWCLCLRLWAVSCHTLACSGWIRLCGFVREYDDLQLIEPQGGQRRSSS